MLQTRLCNVRMLAERLRRFRLSVSWLKAEAEAGRIPCLRAGRRLLFDADAVEAALLRRAAQGDKELMHG